MKRNSNKTVATPPPAAPVVPPLTRDQVMEKLVERIDSRIDDCRKEIDRLVVQRANMYASLATKFQAVALDGPDKTLLNQGLYDVRNSISGSKLLHEQAGQMYAWVAIKRAYDSVRTDMGLSYEAILAGLTEYNVFDALHNSDVSGMSSTDGFSNAVAISEAEGRQRGRRGIAELLERYTDRLKDALPTEG
jgi:hypothetical protein